MSLYKTEEVCFQQKDILIAYLHEIVIQGVKQKRARET